MEFRGQRKRGQIYFVLSSSCYSFSSSASATNLHTITQTTNSPNSNIDSVTETVYGLLKSSTDKSGLTITYQYDALGRKTGSVDPRTGQSLIHYNPKGEIDYTEDPANNCTLFSYDPITGRKSAVTDAENRTVYYLYDTQNHLPHPYLGRNIIKRGQTTIKSAAGWSNL